MIRNVNEQAQTLADYLPNGDLFASKNLSDSNFRALLQGLAEELFRADQEIETFKQDMHPSTLAFVDEWEKSLGIPDDIFSGTGSLAERKQHVLMKLASLGVQTAEDFETIGALLGIDISVEPAAPYAIFPMPFPIILLPSAKVARFTIVVSFTVTGISTFPLTFPITFGTPEMALIERLFEKLKPANCDVIFRQI